jgi:2-polyprenyl-3-methyl-5-hydroxy-6-metoxy-1,4-benzoquinol methylase
MNNNEKIVKYNTVINPSVTENSHSQIIRMITKGSKVLDVGCASCVFGEYLCRELDCEVTGIDYDERALDVARSRDCFYQLHKVDLEKANFSIFDSEIFDYIILGDVIEHIASVKDTLFGLVNCLHPNGKLLISLPNISHGSIRLNLLAGRFAYSSEGILDETHLKFYTPETILKFCEENAFEIVEFGRVFTSIYGMEQKVNPKEFSKSILKFVESDIESWVYQYVFSVIAGTQSASEKNSRTIRPCDAEIVRFGAIKRAKSKSNSWF